MSANLRYDEAKGLILEHDGSGDEWPVVRLDELHALGFVHKDDLAGVGELAEMFQVGKSTVVGWGRRRDSNQMPDVVADLLAGPIYSKSQVQTWWKKWRPRKGRRAGTLDAA